MDLYNKATEFLKMKKHICGENYFRLGLKVTVIMSSDEKIFIGSSTENDLSEYNAFILMKINGENYIKKIICVDEYECVFLPSMKFIDYVVNDNENNSEASVFTDPSHVISVYSIIEINNKEIMKAAGADNRNNKPNNSNNIYNTSASSANDFYSGFDDFSDEPLKPVVVMSEKNKIHTVSNNYATIDSADSLAGGFEDFSDTAARPVVVMKKENNTPIKPYDNQQIKNETTELNYDLNTAAILEYENYISESGDSQESKKSILSFLKSKTGKKNTKK